MPIGSTSPNIRRAIGFIVVSSCLHAGRAACVLTITWTTARRQTHRTGFAGCLRRTVPHPPEAEGKDGQRSPDIDRRLVPLEHPVAARRLVGDGLVVGAADLRHA